MRYISICLLLCLSKLLLAVVPSGYYSTLNMRQSAALKTELHVIICQDTAGYLSYGAGAGRTWQGFYSTDRNLSTNAVIDMYSSTLRYFATNYVALGYPSFGQDLHIEHSLPKSWWGSHEWAAYKDLHHLFPADGSMNLSKSNNPLGVVTGTATTNNGVSKVGPAVYGSYSGNVFEPADEYKGDFARSYFYVATAYENYRLYWDSPMMDKNTYPVFNSWAVALLLQWHRQDPVSDKERTRTDAVYAIQGNRNPYIDLPQLVEYIWGNQVGQYWNLTTQAVEVQQDDLKIVLSGNKDSFRVVGGDSAAISYTMFDASGKRVLQGVGATNMLIRLPKVRHGVYVFEVKAKDKIIKLKTEIIHD